MRAILFLVLGGAASLWGANPSVVVVWSATQMKAIDQKLRANVNPQTHVGVERLMDSAIVVHRVGPSEAEIHTKEADFIVVEAGEGTVLAGGTMVDGKSSGPDEMRGKSIEGGTRYTLKAGDNIFIPANTVHQFLVEPGKEFSATIVKIVPKQ
jgi:mannose-6-phosphate isomerase-like protein (cupin superfamily)